MLICLWKVRASAKTIEPGIQPCGVLALQCPETSRGSPSTPRDVTTHGEQDLSPSSCLGADRRQVTLFEELRIAGKTPVPQQPLVPG